MTLLQLHAIPQDRGKIRLPILSAVRIQCRVASPRSRTIISSVISFTSTQFNCGEPFWKRRRIRVMISAARVPSFRDPFGGRASLSRFGTSPASQWRQLLALVTVAAIWLITFVRQGSGQLSHGGHPADPCPDPTAPRATVRVLRAASLRSMAMLARCVASSRARVSAGRDCGARGNTCQTNPAPCPNARVWERTRQARNP